MPEVESTSIVAAGCPRGHADAAARMRAPASLPDPEASPLRERLRGADALVIGPGLGRSSDTVTALLELLVALPCPAVVDADALNIVAAVGVRSEDAPNSAMQVVTPHPAEMGSTRGRPAREDRAGGSDRHLPSASRAGARRRGRAQGRRRLVVAASGHADTCRHDIASWHWQPGGTGDVLAGLIGSLLAQGLPARCRRDRRGEHSRWPGGSGGPGAARKRAGALASDLIATRCRRPGNVLGQALEAAIARR